MSVTGYLKVDVGLEHSVALDVTTPSEIFQAFTYRLADGTSDDQMDLLWHGEVTSSTELDLFDGSMTDAFGTSCEFEDIRMIYVRNTGTVNVVLGSAVTDEWTALINESGTVTIEPGGVFFVYSPTDPSYAVSSGNAHFKVNTTGSCDVIIGGTSA